MASAFGCFERVDLLFGCRYRGFHVSGQVAVAILPLGSRFGAGHAVPAGFKLRCTVAAIALFYDFVAFAAVVCATLSSHERTFDTRFNRRTDHWNHLLGIEAINLIRPPSKSGLYFISKAFKNAATINGVVGLVNRFFACFIW